MISRRSMVTGTAATVAGVMGLPLFAPAAGASGTCDPEGFEFDPTVPDSFDYPMVAELVPFAHGVGSGDPLADRVNLWTRVTVPDARGWTVVDPQGITSVGVEWRVATDVAMADVVAAGTVVTDAGRDWTVCVDAGGLPAGTTLYYDFSALGARSVVGRTRTAPAADADPALVLASFACASWWQDFFSGYAAVAARDDIDVILHSGDHIYDNSGGHPAVRAYRDRFDLGDIDARDMATIDEARRRHALYYSDPAFLAARRSAPIVVLPDNHDVDASGDLTPELAAQVFWEWTASRPTAADGSFLPSPGPDENRPIPDLTQRIWYRTLPYGRSAQITLIDIRYQSGLQDANDQHELLGNTQWRWLQDTLLDAKARGVRHNVIVNQIQMGQLRLQLPIDLPGLVPLADALGVDPADLQAATEIYPGWGKYPEARAQLFGFLRDNGIVDNVVLSGDSHGWFAWDMVEDNQLPAYEPLGGGGTLGVVGVEMVPSTMGRPGGQDVIAEATFEAAVGGEQNSFADNETYMARYHPLGLAPILVAEEAARVLNPNLRLFNWRTDGFGLVGLDDAGATLELWEVPSGVAGAAPTLLARLRSPLGAPHLSSGGDPVGGPPHGTSVANLPDCVATMAGPPAQSPVPVELPDSGDLPATGGGVLPAAGVAAIAAGLALRRRRSLDS